MATSEAWKAVEDAAAEKRTELVMQALVDTFGGSKDEMPKMGLCLSGGGWRAMTSGCAMFDALSVPYKSTQSGKTVKPLDCFTHAFGLSGGSWMLFNTLAGAAKGKNAFHNTNDNPWLYGAEHSFNPNVHKYEGLCRMVQKEVVDNGCHRGSFRKNMGFVASRVGADATIPSVLASKYLGPTLVERWSNFIANDLLLWLDDGYAVDPSVAAEVDEEMARIKEKMIRDLDAACLSAGARKKADSKLEKDLPIQKDILLASKAPSRSLKFSALQHSISSGALPFTVCCAIANREGVTQEAIDAYEAAKEESEALSNDAEQSHDAPQAERKTFPRIYDWVEFSPFFARNPYNGTLYGSPDEVQGDFGTEGENQPLYVHQLMGICGSAFACDMSCALPTGVQKKVTKNRELSTNPIIGRGTTKVSSAAGSPGVIGECRDAGIDFNVPLPGMLGEAGRQFDIILVMDAGAGSANAHELQRAVELGYLEPPVNLNPEQKFAKGQFVRVYRSKTGGPTIIYFLGLCDRGTHQIICSPKIVEYDCKRLRERVIKQLVPVLIAEVRGFQKRQRRIGQSGGAEGDEEAVIEYIEEDDVDADDEEDALPDDEALNDEVRTLMLAAAATGAVHSEFDAFAAVEYNILFENSSIQFPERNAAIAALENAAMSKIFTPANPVSLETIPKGVYNELVKFGILVPIPAKKGALKRLRSLVSGKPMMISESWCDYYAGTALAAALLRSDPRLLEAIGRHQTPGCPVPGSVTNLPLYQKGKVWSHLASAIKTAVNKAEGNVAVLQNFSAQVFQNFQSFLPNRAQCSAEDKRAALVNFATSLYDLGIMDQLIDLLDRTQLSPEELTYVAEVAAKVGSLEVLQHMVKFPQALDRTETLASAYACPDDTCAQWLVSNRKLSLSYTDACRYGYYEAVNELSRQAENANNKEAAVAALENSHEAVCNVLYNRGNKEYRNWLAHQVQDRGLAWDKILRRSGLYIEEEPHKATIAERASSGAAVAKGAASDAKAKAAGSMKAIGAFGKGLFGKK